MQTEGTDMRTWQGEGEGRTNRERGRVKRVAWRHTHTIWKTASQWGLVVTRGTQPGALGQPTGVGWGWERGARSKGRMYTCG